MPMKFSMTKTFIFKGQTCENFTVLAVYFRKQNIFYLPNLFIGDVLLQPRHLLFVCHTAQLTCRLKFPSSNAPTVKLGSSFHVGALELGISTYMQAA